MKTNEAPEKIYITPNFQRRWFTKEIDDESTEYIYKNVFIEKANKWFEKHLWEHVYGGIEMKNNIFEDFKKYMEGE